MRLPTFACLPRLAGLPLPQVLDLVGRPVAATDVDPPGYMRVHFGAQTVRVPLLLVAQKLRPDIARAVAPEVLARLTANDKQALAYDVLSRVGTVEAVEQLSDGMLKVRYTSHATDGHQVSRTITIAATKFLPAFSPPVGALSSLVGRTFVIAKPAPKAVL